MIDIKIKPLIPDFVPPCKVTFGSAAYDAYLPKLTEVKYGRQVIPLGFALEMPRNIALDCRSRSGYTLKGLIVVDQFGESYRIDADVQLGLIDSDYRGEVGVLLTVRSLRILFGKLLGKRYYIGFCDEEGHPQAIAQLKFCEVPDTHFIYTHDLSETERGGNGFGRQNNE